MSKHYHLSTDDTSLTLSIRNNRPAILELSNHERNWNWTETPTEIPLITNVYTNGKMHELQWTFQDATVDNSDGTRVTLKFVSSSPMLELSSIWQAKPYAGPVEVTTTIENKSGCTITIYQKDVMVADTEFTADAEVELWRFNKLGAIPSGIVPDSKGQDHPIQRDSWSKDAWLPYDALYSKEKYGGPFCQGHEPAILRDVLCKNARIDTKTRNADGWSKDAWLPYHVLSVNEQHGLYLGYVSSFGQFSFSTLDEPLKIRYNASLWHSGFFTIEHGTTLRLPGLFFGTYMGDVDDGSNRMKKWFWKYKLPQSIRDNSDAPLIEYTVPFTEEKLKKFFATYPIADWGGELAKIDIEWMTPTNELGNWNNELHNCYDWTPNPKKWPSGMTAADIAHDYQQKLSLYLFDTYKCCNLGTTEGRKLMEEALLSRYDQWHYDYYRSDYFPEGTYNYPMHMGFMELLDNVISKRPEFRYEHCCGGGALKDFDTLQRISVMTTEDSAGALNYRKAVYSNFYMINPVQLKCDISMNFGQTGHAGDEMSDDPMNVPFIDTIEYVNYCLRTGFMGAMMVCGGATHAQTLTDNQIKGYQVHWPLYKRRMRLILRGADVYHILPYPDGINWDGMQYCNPAIQKGAVLLFKPSENAPYEKTIKLKGLVRDQIYGLIFQDRREQSCTLLGAQLMDDGITVTGMTGEYASEIIWIEHARGPHSGITERQRKL